jgi:hypothetical protein
MGSWSFVGMLILPTTCLVARRRITFHRRANFGHRAGPEVAQGDLHLGLADADGSRSRVHHAFSPSELRQRASAALRSP